MSIFNFFKKKKTIKLETKMIVGDLNTKTRQLFKLATEQKRNGSIEQAIETLKQAKIEAEKETGAYSVKEFLRLPMYLLEAKRADEGWRELNNLIVEGYPKQNKDLSIVMMDYSNIYDKMRLFLQREKKNVDAVKFGIFSYLCWAKGLELQKRKKDLKAHISSNVIEGTISGLLKKANKLDKLTMLSKTVQELTDNLSSFGLAKAGRKIEMLIYGD